jgi:hypothetical protein
VFVPGKPLLLKTWPKQVLGSLPLAFMLLGQELKLRTIQLDEEHGHLRCNKGKGKSTYMFSAERLRISAFRSPACWLYPLKPGGERKSAYIRQKTYTLIYPDPRNNRKRWNARLDDSEILVLCCYATQSFTTMMIFIIITILALVL